MAKKKSLKKSTAKKKPAIDLNAAENIELTFKIGDKLYALKPTGGKLSAEICMQTVLRLALDYREPMLIMEADIIDLSNKLDETINA